MYKTRMWVFETDQYGTRQETKFNIDDPLYIPRLGEFVESDKAAGWVDHVQYDYVLNPKISEFNLIINVYLKREKK